MAQITFNNIETGNQQNNQNLPTMGFFFLKNDQDEALVRIMHDNVESFDILTVHNVTVGGKQRKVNCIRDPHEPLDRCPLCAAGNPVQQRLYIHLLCYTRDENGNIVAHPQIWERTGSYAVTLKNLIDNYGPLSDYLFKIKRNGKPGDTGTTYDIMYANPKVYVPELYPKDTSAFVNYSALGYPVLNKKYEELEAYLATGDFPMKPKVTNPQTAKTNTSSQATYTAPVSPANNTYNTEDVPFTYTPTMTNAAPPVPPMTSTMGNQQAPWQSGPVVARPERKY